MSSRRIVSRAVSIKPVKNFNRKIPEKKRNVKKKNSRYREGFFDSYAVSAAIDVIEIVVNVIKKD